MTNSAARTSINGTGAALTVVSALLLWEHFHGGIQSHHVLNRADLPAISNAWGIVLLPILAWVAITQVLNRMAKNNQTWRKCFTEAKNGREARSAIFGFVGALLFGSLLAFGFSQGFQDFTGYLFLGMFVLALIVPIYRAETLLGFVLSMMWVFGPVLPIGIGAVLALLSASVHLLLWPLLIRAWRWSRT
jgi:hypothetical protein